MNEELNKDRIINRFIESCSHDLRSPVTSIEGLVSIAEHYAEHEEIHECLRMIKGCTQKMHRLLNNLETFMTLSQQALAQKEVCAKDLAQAVLSRHAASIDRKRINVSLNINQSCPWITDPECSHHILSNVIENAVNFSDPGKKHNVINVSLSVNHTEASLTVEDNGIGIPEHEEMKVFNLLYKASSSSHGSGMGLFLVRALTNRLGGACSIKSKEGVGSRFDLSAPNPLLLTFALIALMFMFYTSALGQRLVVSPMIEKTVSSPQYGVVCSVQTNSRWMFGSFYQASITSGEEPTVTKNSFFGAMMFIPLAKSETLWFGLNVRGGLVNEQFLVIVPAAETTIKVTDFFSVAFSGGLRYRNPALAMRVNFIIL